MHSSHQTYSVYDGHKSNEKAQTNQKTENTTNTKYLTSKPTAAAGGEVDVHVAHEAKQQVLDEKVLSLCLHLHQITAHDRTLGLQTT